MPGFVVDPELLQRDDALQQGMVEHTWQALLPLRASADEALAGWHGAAAAAFRLAWEEWFAAAAEMLEALAQLASVIGASGASYVVTEDSVRTDVVRTPA